MVSDVLHALRRAERIDKVVVVTGESGAEALARAYDAETIGDDDRGHSQRRARRRRLGARARRTSARCSSPATAPPLDPRELDELVAGAMSAPDVVDRPRPSRHGDQRARCSRRRTRSTRASAPAAASATSRRRAASGARWRVAEPRSLVLDVDTAEDLAALRAALGARTGGAAHTRGLLARLDRR